MLQALEVTFQTIKREPKQGLRGPKGYCHFWHHEGYILASEMLTGQALVVNDVKLCWKVHHWWHM